MPVTGACELLLHVATSFRGHFGACMVGSTACSLIAHFLITHPLIAHPLITRPLITHFIIYSQTPSTTTTLDILLTRLLSTHTLSIYTYIHSFLHTCYTYNVYSYRWVSCIPYIQKQSTNHYYPPKALFPSKPPPTTQLWTSWNMCWICIQKHVYSKLPRKIMKIYCMSQWILAAGERMSDLDLFTLPHS